MLPLLLETIGATYRVYHKVYPDDNQVHDVVDVFEVAELVLPDLDALFDDVVDDEDDEDYK